MCCKIEGCNNPIHVKKHGLCSKHYSRLRETGTTDDGSRARKPMEQRFWDKVLKTDGCWEWQGCTSEGYGSINEPGRGGKKWRTHRYSWVLHNGEIPKGDGAHGVVVRHKCDNRLCVNPDHLELGSQSDNVKDMYKRNRR